MLWTFFIQVIIPICITAVSYTYHRARTKERELITTRVKHEGLRGALLRLDDVVASVVKELAQTLGESMKLAGDGKLTEESKSLLRSQALDRVRRYMGDHGMAELTQVLRLAEGGLTDFIASRLEAQVYDLKRSKGSSLPDTGIRLAPPSLNAASGMSQ